MEFTEYNSFYIVAVVTEGFGRLQIDNQELMTVQSRYCLAFLLICIKVRDRMGSE